MNSLKSAVSDRALAFKRLACQVLKTRAKQAGVAPVTASGAIESDSALSEARQANNVDSRSSPDPFGVTDGYPIDRSDAVLHTLPARQLFYGGSIKNLRRPDHKQHPPAVGLIEFIRKVSSIYNASADQDPFADWTLINIEEALDNAQSEIKRRQSHLNDLLSGRDSIEHKHGESIDSVQAPRVSNSPLSVQATRVLVLFDRLVRFSHIARNHALVSTDNRTDCISTCSTAIQSGFELVNTWKYTGVTRYDMATNSPVARQAKEIYASDNNKSCTEIPEDILQAKRRPRRSLLARTKSLRLYK